MDKIAAGEVIERPASVVRELVDNSLDAGAGEIMIELRDGGREAISVVDNGCGMSREDAVLALKRHATSKIKSLEDLKLLKTLGFRGEALPSIASVSRFELRTYDGFSGAGVRIRSSGGLDEEVSDCAMPRGCEIEANGLFFNTPARKKFLKTASTELSHIVDFVTRAAVYYHRVRFLLRNNGKETLNFPGTDDPGERLLQVFGGEIFSGLFPVAQAVFPFKMRGFASSPGFTSSSASSLYIYINGRFIPDPIVRRAVLTAYGNIIEKGRYPYAVLLLDFSTPDVDFNVHPQKAEVRFANGNEVFSTVLGRVKETVTAAPWIAAGGNRDMPATRTTMKTAYPSAGRLSQESLFERIAGFPPALPDDIPKMRFSGVRPLGQYAKCFIIGQYGDSLVLIDQHAAHERVNFERMKRAFFLGDIASQPLLMPETSEIPSFLMPALEENSLRLLKLGFEVEIFSGNTVL
ncbi:MAG: DNA mismatch repair endonuclease MutL, partial [Deltaproteobacteria bacterium]|nr:DNA mismatch repair endonuclease MutL [Deltaproteobacteria bacterium]